jgi:hypothetical protein
LLAAGNREVGREDASTQTPIAVSIHRLPIRRAICAYGRMSNQHPRGTLGLVAIGALKRFKSALLAGLGALLFYDSGQDLIQSASQ